MRTELPSNLSEIQITLCIVFLMLAPLSGCGLALINAGLGRSRNAAHSMMAALCVIAIAACAWFVCGWAFEGYPGGLTYSFQAAGRQWYWVGAEPWFFRGLAASSASGGSPAYLFAWFGVIAAGLAGLIPLGSSSDRWRVGSICASTALLAGLTFPLFGHWSWGGGWLAQMGSNFRLGRGYIDAGGSGTIHATGGLTALAVAWIVGPRRGKYGPEGMPMALPGHNAVLVLFGCMIAFVGWLGLNSAGAVLFGRADTPQIPLIAINTLMGAAAAALAAAIVTKLRFGKPDASLTANGWVGGLVAGSAGCAALPPAVMVIIGLVAGALIPFLVELLDLRLEIDDPGGAISVHAAGGIWGVFAVGLFGGLGTADAPGQLIAQVVGIATLIGFVFPLTYGLNRLLNRVLPQRVGIEGDQQGMDLHELGAGAYPEFMTHTDDFMR